MTTPTGSYAANPPAIPARQAIGRSRFQDIIGSSEAMQRVYDAIAQVADSKINVIVRGESGTGKELVARALVALSRRHDRPFISLAQSVTAQEAILLP